MESPNPKFALYGNQNGSARSNTLLLLLSEVSIRAVIITINEPKIVEGEFTVL